MKRFLFSVALAMGAISTANAASAWYNQTYPRTVYIKFEQPIIAATIFIAGRSVKTSSCIKKIGSMAFVPASTVKKDFILQGQLGLVKNSATGNFSATSLSSATYSTPAVYKYTTYDVTFSALTYNIVYTRGGVRTSATGWQPVSDACTYPVN